MSHSTIRNYPVESHTADEDQTSEVYEAPGSPILDPNLFQNTESLKNVINTTEKTTTTPDEEFIRQVFSYICSIMEQVVCHGKVFDKVLLSACVGLPNHENLKSALAQPASITQLSNCIAVNLEFVDAQQSEVTKTFVATLDRVFFHEVPSVDAMDILMELDEAFFAYMKLIYQSTDKKITLFQTPQTRNLPVNLEQTMNTFLSKIMATYSLIYLAVQKIQHDHTTEDVAGNCAKRLDFLNEVLATLTSRCSGPFRKMATVPFGVPAMPADIDAFTGLQCVVERPELCENPTCLQHATDQSSRIEQQEQEIAKLQDQITALRAQKSTRSRSKKASGDAKESTSNTNAPAIPSGCVPPEIAEELLKLTELLKHLKAGIPPKRYDDSGKPISQPKVFFNTANITNLRNLLKACEDADKAIADLLGIDPSKVTFDHYMENALQLKNSPHFPNIKRIFEMSTIKKATGFYTPENTYCVNFTFYSMWQYYKNVQNTLRRRQEALKAKAKPEEGTARVEIPFIRMTMLLLVMAFFGDSHFAIKLFPKKTSLKYNAFKIPEFKRDINFTQTAKDIVAVSLFSCIEKFTGGEDLEQLVKSDGEVSEESGNLTEFANKVWSLACSDETQKKTLQSHLSYLEGSGFGFRPVYFPVGQRGFLPRKLAVLVFYFIEQCLAGSKVNFGSETAPAFEECVDLAQVFLNHAGCSTKSKQPSKPSSKRARAVSSSTTSKNQSELASRPTKSAHSKAHRNVGSEDEDVEAEKVTITNAVNNIKNKSYRNDTSTKRNPNTRKRGPSSDEGTANKRNLSSANKRSLKRGPSSDDEGSSSSSDSDSNSDYDSDTPNYLG